MLKNKLRKLLTAGMAAFIISAVPVCAADMQADVPTEFEDSSETGSGSENDLTTDETSEDFAEEENGSSHDQGALIAEISALEDTGSTDIPYFEFTNTSNDTPDLYVKKTVKSAVPDIEPPADAVFHFTIKVNGSFYGDQEYEVYGSDGRQILNYADGHGASNVEVPFMTDRNGGFTLQGGQTAKFPNIGEASYEVIEDSEVPGFTQTQPAGGGSRTGTVAPTGSTAEFVNTWYPDTETEQPVYTKLEVKKSVLHPDNFELPETPDFTFELKIGGKPYANRQYSIENADGTDGGYGATDSKGCFTLKGGQTAVFEEIETGMDYAVKEILPEGEGWRQVGSASPEGETKAPLTHAEFTNTAASFAVRKSMQDYSTPDIEFTFVLSDETGNPMASTEYYLYDQDGNLLEADKLTTDESGQFVLKPGQTALFVGVDPGKQYTVKELEKLGFEQISPASAEGFAGTVQDNSLTVHEFINAQAIKASFTVLKIDEESMPLENVKFKLLKSGSAENPWYAEAEQKGNVWEITGWNHEGTEMFTDSDGKFSISGLDEGSYILKETEPLKGYLALTDIQFSIQIYTSETGELQEIDLTLQGQNSAEFSGSIKDGTGLLTVINKRNVFSLPDTGGPGTVFFFTAGLFLILSSAVLTFVIRRRK